MPYITSITILNILPQYAFEDFAVRQVALLLNKTDDVAKYTNRSLVRIYPCQYVYEVFSCDRIVLS